MQSEEGTLQSEPCTGDKASGSNKMLSLTLVSVGFFVGWFAYEEGTVSDFLGTSFSTKENPKTIFLDCYGIEGYGV